MANSQCLQNVRAKLKEEIDQTDSLIRWAENHILYRDTRVRLRSSGNDKPSELHIKSVAPYTLAPIKDLEGIRKNFNLYTNQLQLVQSQKDGLSDFEINISTQKESSALDNFHRNYSPTHHIQTIYRNGQPVSLNDLGVAKADSVMLQTTMHLPLSMKTLTIQKEDSILVYGSDSVDYFWIDEDEFEIEVPLALYPKVLSFQAIDKQGRYMDANSKSSIPLFHISKEALCCLREMKDIRTKCLALDNEDAIKALLSSFTPLQKNTERDMKQIYQLYLDKNIEAILNYTDKPLWSIQEVQLWAAYPRFVEKIVLYMADREEQLKSEHIVYVGSEEKYRIASWTGEDHLSQKKQFSLIDDEGKKFVTFPDSLLRLIYKGDNYYEGTTEGVAYSYSYYSYWLNEKKQQIEKLPFRFTHQFNDASVVGVTEGKDSYNRYGVYSNDHLHKELLAPNYSDMWKVGTYLIAINNKENKTDFYDSDLHKLEGMNYQVITFGKTGFEADYMFVCDTCSGMKGMLNKQLELSVPCIYTYISEIKEDRFYVTDQTKLCGVIDCNNRVVLPLKYDFIIYGSEDEGSLWRFDKEGKTGYMNQKYREVIPARFDDGSNFVEGYAMVIQGNTYGIINTKGEYVMKENFTGANHSYNFGYPNRDVVYEINGKQYNYKGERLE